MTKVLLLQTSSRAESISNMLADEFLAALGETAALDVTVENLAARRLPNLDEAGIAALRTAVEAPTAAQQEVLAVSDALVAQIKAADLVVLAAPMHNFTVSAALRTYFDYLARPGVTFGYSENGPHGLIDDKPVAVISTRGGQYGDGSPDGAAPADFQSGYLRQILGFLGLKSVHIIAANGMDMGDAPKAEGLAAARARFADIIGGLSFTQAAE